MEYTNSSFLALNALQTRRADRTFGEMARAPNSDEGSGSTVG